MLKFGTVGRVRLWIAARVAVYGDPGPASSVDGSTTGGGDAVGPAAGPLMGSE